MKNRKAYFCDIEKLRLEEEEIDVKIEKPINSAKTERTDFPHYQYYLPWNHILRGALEFTIPTFQTDYVKHSIERNDRIFLDLINNGKVDPAPRYSHKMKPTDAQEACNDPRKYMEEFIGVVFDLNRLCKTSK